MLASDQQPADTKGLSAETVQACGNICSACPKRFICPVAALQPGKTASR